MGIYLDFLHFHLLEFKISHFFMLLGKCHIFTTALRKPSADEGIAEESHVGLLPLQLDSSGILGCLTHDITLKKSSHRKGSAEGKNKRKKEG